VLIDLGELGEDGWPVIEPAVRRAAPPVRRWPLAVAVLVLVGLFAVGSLPVSGVESVAGLPAHTLGFAADAENLYAIREDPTVTAYGWRDGEIRWTRTFSISEGQLYLAAGRPFIRHRPCTQATGWSLEGLEPRTGRPLWLRAGGPLAVLRAGDWPTLLMVEEPNAACPVVRPAILGGQVMQPPMRLTALYPDSGAIRWSYVQRTGRLVVPSGEDGSWFATWYPDGRAEARDAATGAVSSTAVLPELADRPPQGVRVVGDLLVIITSELDGAVLTAYRREGLTLAWRRPFATVLPAPIAELAYGPSVVGCGPVICIPTWREVSVLDAETGRTLWQRELQFDEVGPGVLVARDRDDFMHAHIVDWRTGRDIADLPGWGVVPLVGDADAIALVQSPQGAHARLAAVDLRTGQLRTWGPISPIPSRCALSGRRLACLAGGDTVHVWRVPDSP
jgi:hypothetical protein